VGSCEEVQIYYPFHAYAGCKLKSRQQWRVPGDCAIVQLEDGSLLKLPAWMISVEAAVFEISKTAVVDIEGLKLVCELMDKSQLKEQDKPLTKQFTLEESQRKSREGEVNESATSLDRGRKSGHVRRAYEPGDSGNHGRGNTRSDSGKKGGKR
jgi:hypothetical protein